MSRLLYPDPLSGNLPSVSLSQELRRVHNFGTAQAMAHRIPLRFDSAALVVVTVDSTVGRRRNWKQAGYLAQMLYGIAGQPKKQVRRLYLDEAFFELDGAGYPYFLEFWSRPWIKDYYLEIWARLLPGAVAASPAVTIGGQPFTIGGQPFTIGGQP